MFGTPLIGLGLVLAGGSLVTSIALLAGAARVGRPVLVAATAS